MGPALTHKDVDIRLKGTKFLSDLIIGLPSDLLDDKQLTFITSFYCDRMKDHHSIAPCVVSGLVAIVKMHNLPRTAPAQILQQLFANIPCQSQVRGDRANIFFVLQHLSDNYQTELEAMGADFIYGVIQACEGERDPRNLVFLFEFLPRFIATYSLRHLTEEMFEVFSCYFPIDFHPSPNDPQAITRDSLAEKLSNGLCASKDFADCCFTLALEKLDSDLKVAKLDSLKLLIKAATNFESTATLERFDDIWQALKPEILPGAGNLEVIDTALSVIAAIIKKLNSEDANREIVLNKIFTNIIGTLLNRDAKLYKPTMKVVLTCADATDGSCVYVANKFLPITLTDLTSNEEVTDTEKSEALEDLSKILMIVKKRNLLSSYSGDNCILHIQKEVMKILITPSSPELLKVTWSVMTNMSGIVSDENRQIMYKKLNKELTTAKPEQVDCLLSMAKVHPNEVNQLVLASYINRSFDDHVEAKTIFKTLSTLLTVPELRDHIIEVLCLNVFNNKKISIQLVVLEVINDILSAQKTNDIAKILCDEWKIVVKLIDLIKNGDPDECQDVMYQASVVS